MGLLKGGVVWPGDFKILAMPKFTQPPKFGRLADLSVNLTRN